MPTVSEPNLYHALGIEESATQEEIRKAYKKKALETHPDRNINANREQKSANEERFRLVQRAYETLHDPQTRAEYDARRRRTSVESDSEDDDIPPSYRRAHRSHRAHEPDPFSPFFNHGGPSHRRHHPFHGAGPRRSPYDAPDPFDDPIFSNAVDSGTPFSNGNGSSTSFFAFYSHGPGEGGGRGFVMHSSTGMGSGFHTHAHSRADFAGMQHGLAGMQHGLTGMQHGLAGMFADMSRTMDNMLGMFLSSSAREGAGSWPERDAYRAPPYEAPGPTAWDAPPPCHHHQPHHQPQHHRFHDHHHGHHHDHHHDHHDDLDTAKVSTRDIHQHYKQHHQHQHQRQHQLQHQKHKHQLQNQHQHYGHPPGPGPVPPSLHHSGTWSTAGAVPPSAHHAGPSTSVHAPPTYHIPIHTPGAPGAPDVGPPPPPVPAAGFPRALTGPGSPMYHGARAPPQPYAPSPGSTAHSVDSKRRLRY